MRSLRHGFVWILGFTAFVMNPSFACSSGGDVEEFEYGEAEIIAAVQGTWRLTYTRPEGTSVITFNIAPGPAPKGQLASPPGLTPQCGNRTFTRPAAACFPTSQLALAATVVEAEPPLDTMEGSGWYTAYGTKYSGDASSLCWVRTFVRAPISTRATRFDKATPIGKARACPPCSIAPP